MIGIIATGPSQPSIAKIDPSYGVGIFDYSYEHSFNLFGVIPRSLLRVYLKFLLVQISRPLERGSLLCTYPITYLTGFDSAPLGNLSSPMRIIRDDSLVPKHFTYGPRAATSSSALLTEFLQINANVIINLQLILFPINTAFRHLS